MPRYEVIESRVWKRDDGATASPYGASPWETEREKSRWKLVTRGYTVRDNVSGTVGIGRVPWQTREEAQSWANKENERLGELAAAHERARKTATQLQHEIDENLTKAGIKRPSRKKRG